MTGSPTRGEQVIARLREDTGYDPYSDYSDEQLIAYKDRLEELLTSALDRPGLTVTLTNGHAETNHDAGLAATLRRVADQVADGEFCGTVYDTSGDDVIGCFDLAYGDSLRRASDLSNRIDVDDPRGGGS